MTIARLGLPLLAVASVAPVSGAQTVKLNAPLVRGFGGSVQGFETGATGSRAVYLADQEVPGRLQLYGVPLDRSAPPVRLSPGTSAVARSFAVSRDGSRVAFLVGTSLHVAPTDGSSAALVLTGPIPIEDTGNFGLVWSPDGAWIAYRETLTGVVLSAVPSDGSTPPVDLSAAGTVPRFEVSPDSQRVVFLRAGGLSSVAIDGSSPVADLDPAGPGSVQHFEIAPDGGTVVFVADHGGPRELWSAPTDGSASAVKVSGTMVPGGAVQPAPWDVEIVADSARVAFLADRVVVGRVELWIAPLDGSAPPVPLSGALAAGREVDGLELTPDGRRVLFLADLDEDETHELFMTTLDGAHPPVKVSPPLDPGGDVWRFLVTPDSQRVVFAAERTDGPIELFSAPIGKLRRGPEPGVVRLNEPLAPATYLGEFVLSNPGHHVVYRASLAGRGYGEWAVPVGGGASIALTSDFASASWTYPAPGERGLLFADLAGLSGYELFVQALDGSAPWVRLSDPLPPGPAVGDVRGFRVTQAGDVVYLADQEQDEQLELYRTPLDGSAPPVKLSAPLVPGGSVGGYLVVPSTETFVLSPDGSRFAYVADQEIDNLVELFGGPLDGSTPPVRLSEPVDPQIMGGVQPGVRFDADGSRLVYRAFRDVFAKVELFSVPADGSSAPVALSGAITSGGDVEADFALASDGSRVVWRADAVTDDKLELWSAPVDGSASRLRLSATMASTRDVVEHAIEPSGQRVLFRADAALEDVFELYSVPLAGGSAPLRLHPALPSGRNVTAFLADPEGVRVVYLADADVDERFELYSVPVAGGTPVKLNGALVAGGDVGRYLRVGCVISPDATRVAYVADQDVDERFELYVAPIDGSAPAVKVSGTMVAGGDVGTDDVTPSAVGNYLEITPDSACVLFLADRETDGVNELWIAPLDASAPPRRLGTPPGSRTVDSFALDRHGFRALYRTHALGNLTHRELFAVPLDGSHAAEPLTDGPCRVDAYAHGPEPTRALFLADQDAEGVTELFSTRLRRAPRPSEPPR